MRKNKIMQKKILIFGNGQIGNMYLRHFQQKKINSKIANIDITKQKKVEKVIDDFSPQIVINTAAKTNLEWCANNQLKAFDVNVLGANNIANVCDQKSIYFIHFSSGCIFQSKDEYDEKKENSQVDPQAFYSFTKVWSEQIITFKKSEKFKYLILRPRQPISSEVSHKNMLIKMLTFQNFIDTPNTGTVLEDLMDWTDVIIKKQIQGILHVANPGWITPYEIGLMLKEIINPKMKINKIEKKELNKITPNQRVDTVLNVDKLRSFGIEPVQYRDRIYDVVLQLKNNIQKQDKSSLEKVLRKTVSESKQRTKINTVWKEVLNL